MTYVHPRDERGEPVPFTELEWARMFHAVVHYPYRDTDQEAKARMHAALNPESP